MQPQPQLSQNISTQQQQKKQLPQPNQLQKRKLLKPLSIFPFVLQLPEFKYSQQSQCLLEKNKNLFEKINKFNDNINKKVKKQKNTNNSKFNKTPLQNIQQKPINTNIFPHRLSFSSNINNSTKKRSISSLLPPPSQSSFNIPITTRQSNLLLKNNIGLEKQKQKQKILQLEQTQLKILFKQPIYVYNKRLSKGENKNYANVKVFCEESKLHNNTYINNQYESKPMKFTNHQSQSSNLSFQSHFQSGNLAFATISLSTPYTYHLLLTKDFNTSQCTQWFFFKITNILKSSTNYPYKFNILNFYKSYSIFESGMQICICKKSNNYQWIRGGNNIKYRKTNIKIQREKKEKDNLEGANNNNNYNQNYNNLNIQERYLYALSFQYQFTEDNDETYFAYSYPYTYTMLDRFLMKIQNQQNYLINQNIESQNIQNNQKNKEKIYINEIFRRQTIGHSLGGNNIDLITITNFKSLKSNKSIKSALNQQKNNENTQKLDKSQKPQKRIIFITCRVHPGQTPSSFIMQGIIKRLIQNTQQSHNLRQNFIFKLIPMLNPDGVINGNYRCSLSGWDMNRIWNNKPEILKQKFPQILYTKRSLQSFPSKPFMYIDLHSHSQKKGIFMYGCLNKLNPFLPRQIPFLFHKSISSFNYSQCHFTLNKKRQGTARVNLFKQYGILLSYTLECSFCGPIREKKQFCNQQYQNIGKQFMNVIQKYYCIKRKNNFQKNIKQNLLEQLHNNNQYLKIGTREADDSDEDSQLEAKFQIQNQNVQNVQKQHIPRHQIITFIKNSINNFHEQPRITHRIKNFSAHSTNIHQQRIKFPLQVKPPKPKPIQPQKISKVGLHQHYLSQDQQHHFNNNINNNNNNNKIPQKFNIIQQLINQPATSFIRSQHPNLFSLQQQRYSQSYDQINNLTNLFLPSVTSMSYKKYGKIKQSSNNNHNHNHKACVQIGRKFLQTTMVKPEIQANNNTGKKNKIKIEWMKKDGNNNIINSNTYSNSYNHNNNHNHNINSNSHAKSNL